MKITRFLSLLSLVFLFSINSFAITLDEFSGELEVVAGASPEYNTDTLSIAPNVITGRSSIIGGSRDYFVDGLTGSGLLKTRLTTSLNFLSHSQDNAASGTSQIIWDGPATTLDPEGLGGIDFKQDGSSAIVLDFISFDSPYDESVDIKIEVFSNGSSASEATITLDTEITTPTSISIPFASFTQRAGASSPADFTSVGAVRMTIFGFAEAVDLAIEEVGTDACRYVPDDDKKVVDECGVCNGDNTTCADCLDVPNGPALPGVACDNGELGVCLEAKWTSSCTCQRLEEPQEELCDGLDNDCDGDIDESFPTLGETCGAGDDLCQFNGTIICTTDQLAVKCDGYDLLKQQADLCDESRGCDDVPNSGLVFDQCNVCGGDGTSCLDCKGEVFGTAKVDRCGICNGDGQSCLNCQDEVQDTTLAEMDNGAAIQLANVKKLARKYKRKAGTKKAKRFASKLVAKAALARNTNWETLSGVPKISTTCENRQFCVSVSNQDKLSIYIEGSEELRGYGETLIRKLAKFIKQKRLEKFQSRNNSYHNENLTQLAKIPVLQSVCN